MIRLKPKDVKNIPKTLKQHDAEFKTKVGAPLAEISKRAAGFNGNLTEAFRSYRAAAVPITTGRGRIEGFTEAVAAIANYMGLKTEVTKNTDLKGFADAVSMGANTIFAADDKVFAGFNFKLLRISYNSEATGRAYAAALELKAGSVDGELVSVVGLGRVGLSAVEYLYGKGAMIHAFDKDRQKLRQLAHRLPERVHVCGSLRECLRKAKLILLAAPSKNFIPAGFINSEMVFSAPAIPLGLTHVALKKLPRENLIHDPLQLGVAAMSVELVK